MFSDSFPSFQLSFKLPWAHHTISTSNDQSNNVCSTCCPVPSVTVNFAYRLTDLHLDLMLFRSKLKALLCGRQEALKVELLLG